MVPANVLVGTVWKAKADNIAAAGLAVAIGVDDDEWIATLHPITPVVYEGSRHLREAHDPVAYDEAVGRSVANGALAACASGAATLAPIPKNPGWRVAGTLPDEAAGALLATARGRSSVGTPGAAHHDTEPARAGGGCGSGRLDQDRQDGLMAGWDSRASATAHPMRSIRSMPQGSRSAASARSRSLRNPELFAMICRGDVVVLPARRGTTSH